MSFVSMSVEAPAAADPRVAARVAGELETLSMFAPCSGRRASIVSAAAGVAQRPEVEDLAAHCRGCFACAVSLDTLQRELNRREGPAGVDTAEMYEPPTRSSRTSDARIWKQRWLRLPGSGFSWARPRIAWRWPRWRIVHRWSQASATWGTRRRRPSPLALAALAAPLLLAGMIALLASDGHSKFGPAGRSQTVAAKPVPSPRQLRRPAGPRRTGLGFHKASRPADPQPSHGSVTSAAPTIPTQPTPEPAVSTMRTPSSPRPPESMSPSGSEASVPVPSGGRISSIAPTARPRRSAKRHHRKRSHASTTPVAPASSTPPPAAQPATPPPPTQSGPYTVTGTDQLAIQSEPAVNHVVGWIPVGTTLQVICQVTNGSTDPYDGLQSTVWDKIPQGWVYDYYVKGPSGQSPSGPAC
jgi:hypothetical protein